MTIGNFDGVHLGHQSVIQQVQQLAKANNIPSLVMFFEPQPIEFFAPKKAPKRLYRLREKLIALKELGVDYVYCVGFDRFFSELSAEDFVEQYLVNSLKVKHLIVGDDFCFGKNRTGDFSLLKTMAAVNEFEVQNTQTCCKYNERVSSTKIRKNIGSNNFVQAAKLLGRPYALQGKISHGKKLGRTIGFPTINIKIGKIALVVEGIFAVRVKGLDNSRPLESVEGVASIGTRPTVGGIEMLLEIYLLNFNQQVYGKTVSVEFLHYLRSEQKFDSIEVMIEHINNDVSNAKNFFKSMS